MKFKTITVKGQEFEVEVHQDGKFGANFPDSGHHAYPSLTELEQALIKHLAKATYKFAIPFARWKDSKLWKGIATGLHARTNNVLVKWADGSTEQTDSWRSHGGDFLRFPSKQAEAEFVHTLEQAEAFELKRRMLVAEYSFDARKELRETIDQKVKAAATTEAEAKS